MSGLLRPIGPEDPQVYWMRRAAIAVVVVLVALIIIAATRPGRSGPTAVPSPTPSTLLLGDPTASAAPAATPTPGATATPGATPTPGGTPTPGSTPTPGATAAAAVTPQPSPTPSAPTACQATDLRVAVAGGAGALVGKASTFTVTLTNGASTACTMGWEPATAELRIQSGTDRIWSTKDCPAWFTKVAPTVVQPGQALSAKVDWQGRRSYPGCKLASSDIRPGTYVATAEVQGAAAAKKAFAVR